MNTLQVVEEKTVGKKTHPSRARESRVFFIRMRTGYAAVFPPARNFPARAVVANKPLCSDVKGALFALVRKGRWKASKCQSSYGV